MARPPGSATSRPGSGCSPANTAERQAATLRAAYAGGSRQPVLINGKWLSAQASGMQRYAGEVARRVLDLDPAARVVVPRDAALPDWLPAGRVLRSRLRGIAFEQLALPLASARRDAAELRRPRARAQARPARRHARRDAGALPPHVLAPLRALVLGALPGAGAARTPPRDRLGVQPRRAGRGARRRPGPLRPRAERARARLRGACRRGRADPRHRARRQAPPTTTCSASAPSRRARTSARSPARSPRPASRSSSSEPPEPAACSPRSPPLDAPGIHLAGRLSDGELALLLRNARALVFPSLYEGFGLPVVEAQALGCPVVASDATSIPEVAGRGRAVLRSAASRGRGRAGARADPGRAPPPDRARPPQRRALLVGPDRRHPARARDRCRAVHAVVPRAAPHRRPARREDRAVRQLVPRPAGRGRAVLPRAEPLAARRRARGDDRDGLDLARGRRRSSPPRASRVRVVRSARPYPPDRKGSRPAALVFHALDLLGSIRDPARASAGRSPRFGPRARAPRRRVRRRAARARPPRRSCSRCTTTPSSTPARRCCAAGPRRRDRPLVQRAADRDREPHRRPRAPGVPERAAAREARALGAPDAGAARACCRTAGGWADRRARSRRAPRRAGRGRVPLPRQAARHQGHRRCCSKRGATGWRVRPERRRALDRRAPARWTPPSTPRRLPVACASSAGSTRPHAGPRSAAADVLVHPLDLAGELPARRRRGRAGRACRSSARRSPHRRSSSPRSTGCWWLRMRRRSARA